MSGNVGVLASQTVLTPRHEVRLPVEADRARFVQLFRDESFMVFSAGVLDSHSAHRRFDEMLKRARNVPSQNVVRKLGFEFWKQAVVDGFLDNLYRLQVPTVSAS